MYSEVSVVELIEINLGIIQVRTTNKVLKDGEEIARTYHRHTLEHGADLTGQDPLVVAVANAAWGVLFPEA